MKTLFLFALLGLSFGVGCTAIDRATDCQQICERYRDCANSSYNVSTCQTRCRDNAANNDDYDNRVDLCENCLDDRSCVSSVFGCGTECAGIVP